MKREKSQKGREGKGIRQRGGGNNENSVEKGENVLQKKCEKYHNALEQGKIQPLGD